MEQPLISIITVCFNSAQTIETCLNSIKNQSYNKIEHICIDGGSTDGTQNIIESFKPNYFKSEKDNGIYNAMNKGLNQSTGEYCIYLNADDYLANNKVIEQIVSHISSNDIICAGIEIFKQEKKYRDYKATNFKPWMFVFGHQPPHPGFLCKTKLLKQVGGFNENFAIAGDFDAMLRLFSLPEIKWKSISLVAVNMMHGGASSGSFTKKREMNQEIKKSLKNNGKPSWHINIWAKYIFKVFQLRTI